jgi:hypothetical protein
MSIPSRGVWPSSLVPSNLEPVPTGGMLCITTLNAIKILKEKRERYSLQMFYNVIIHSFYGIDVVLYELSVKMRKDIFPVLFHMVAESDACFFV